MPCGGGGLLSGCAIAAKHLSPGCKVIGVEPEAGDDATRSFKTGVLQTVHNPDTIADGARTPYLGQYTFPLVRQYVDDMLTVSDDDLIRAMQLRLDAAQAGGRADRRAGPGRGVQPPASRPGAARGGDPQRRERGRGEGWGVVQENQELTRVRTLAPVQVLWIRS